MTICYVCRKCGAKLKISGFEAINEVGRKHCDLCGSNGYLEVVSEDKFTRAKSRYERLMERSVYDANKDANTRIKPPQDGRTLLNEAFEENE